MASVHGSKVKEPRLIMRSGVPMDKQAPYTADLARAWESFGEARSVLHRLEEASGSPPIKDRTQRSHKPHRVHFDSRRSGAALGERLAHSKTPYSRSVHTDDTSKNEGWKENKYIVEPTALNELDPQRMEVECHEGVGGGGIDKTVYRPGRTLSPSHAKSVPSHKVPSSSAGFTQRYDSTVRFAVPPSASPPSTLHPSPPSHPHTVTDPSSTHRHASALSPSNPNSIVSSRSRPDSSGGPYSNSAAVFGPPVKFGEHAREPPPRQPPPRQPTMVRPAEPSVRTHSLPRHHHPHATTSTGAKPRTSSSQTATATTRVGGAGSITVPIRTFELPTDTLDTLRAKIEQQKQAVREISAKAGGLGARHSSATAAGRFHSLPEASTTATSSFVSSISGDAGPPHVPHPPPSRPHEAERAAKRRKIASAPPPQTYTGFSSARSGTKTAMSWKPNLESLGAVGGVGGVASGSGAPQFSSQQTGSGYEPPKRSHKPATSSTARVRKVQRIPATAASTGVTSSTTGTRGAWGTCVSSKPSAPSSNTLITTSSWRAGKELTDKILKGGADRGGRSQAARDYHSSGRNREDNSPQYSSASESQSHPSSSQENISSVSSSIDARVRPHETGRSRLQQDDPRSVERSDQYVGSSLGRAKAEGRDDPKHNVAVDVAGILEDLESTDSPLSVGGGGEGGGGVRGRATAIETGGAGLGRARSASGGPSSKKPRYNVEPTYPTERVRHYDQAKVQSYMQKKQEDRRKKELEERQAREKMAKEREEKLKQLYDAQRKRVEANLRVKQKQREAYSKALASSSVHIHLHSGGSATSSTSSFASETVPRPTLTIQPPTPVSISPSAGSLTLHVQTGPTGLPRSSPLLSPHHRSSLRHTPTPPSHSPTPPRSSPSRRLGASPSLHDGSRSPSISPRTYSVPSSTSTSPRAHTSPQGPTEHAQLRHGVHTAATEHAQLRHGIHTAATEHAQLRHGTHTTATEHAQYGISSAPQSRDERIRALTESALRLKERIAMESKRIEGGAFVQSAPWLDLHKTQQQRSPPTQPQSHRQANEQGLTPSINLPGVGNVHEHAQRAERLRRESVAAAKIQAAYRGHRVRKSLRWKLPSGQTLRSSLRKREGPPTSGVGEGRESRDSSTGTLTPAEEDEDKEGMPTPVISPLRSHERQSNLHSHIHGHPPPISMATNQQGSTSVSAARPSPWQQVGGDEHSIINVFTRQHERLRETLNQLRDQKQAESRHLGDDSETAHKSPKSTSDVNVTPPRVVSVDASHPYSYTHTFEQVTPTKSTSERSPRSSIFSEDSLHGSPPAKRDPVSKVSPSSSSSSTHSHHVSPGGDSVSSRSRASPSAINGTTASHSNKTESKGQEQRDLDVDDSVHAITPPGSASFVESFASVSPRSRPSSKAEPRSLTQMASPHGGEDAGSSGPQAPPLAVDLSSAATGPAPPLPPSSDGRLSPRSLELKLHSELNLLETVEDSMRQISQVESARAVSLAQQETVTLAQLLKSKQQGHEQELQSVASKTEKELENARDKLKRETALLAEQRLRMEREHSEEMSRMREEASKVAHEATLRLNEARSAASEAVIRAAKDNLEAAHTIASSAASAAAREAVKATLASEKHHRESMLRERQDEPSTASSGRESPRYESDFETDSLADSETDGGHSDVRPKLKPTPSTSTRSHASSSSSSTIEEEEEEEEEESGRREEESVTPVAPPEEVMEVTSHGDATLVGDISDEVEESYRSQSPVDELEDSHGEGSRVPSPMPSELSPSPGAGEDSFFQFMSRMMHAYMHEEELRARHKATLLRLRENALEEKTKAHLEWLKIKKKALQSKGDDDKMPPLARMERGLLKKYKKQQAEIHQLKEAQKAARRERRLMLHQHKEISQMRRSAQYYQNKIHQHRYRASRSPSPSPSLLLDEIQNASHLIDESEVSMADTSVAEELSETEDNENRLSVATLSDDLERSSTKDYSEDFQSYSPSSPEPVPTATAQTGAVYEEEGEGEEDRTLTESGLLSSATPVRSKPKSKSSPPSKKSPPGGGKKTKSPKSLKSPTSDSHTVKQLENLASTDPQEYLAQREQRLIKRCKAAEEVLKQQQELLKKEQILDREEEKVNKLVTEALACYKQREKIKKVRTKDRSRHSSGEEPATGKAKSPKSKDTSVSTRLSVGETADQLAEPQLGQSKSSISEEIRVSGSITEEISEEELLSRTSTSHPLSDSLVHTAISRATDDYTMDAFESDTQSRHDQPPRPLTTSTPSQGSLKKLPQASDDLSISITESLSSMTSDGSALEERIRLLKQQLQQKKEEMKKFQNEQKRKKKTFLRQQEEQLRRKLEMVENKAKQMKAASPSRSLHSPGTATPTSTASATPSQVHSERSESERSASPQPINREAHLIETNQRPIADKERSLSPPPGQDRTSPAPPSYSYTPFSDGMTSASASGVVDGLAREETTVRSGKLTPPSSPPTSAPEEEPDTSRSTLVDDEGAEEIVGVVGGDDKGHPHQLADTAPVERVEGEAFVEKEDSLRGDDLSVRSDSISEHYSDMSEEEEDEEGEGEGERVEMELPPSYVKPPADHQTIAASEQYTETFEEPSSSSSSPMPQRTPTPPIEPEGEALMAAATEWEPRPSEEREDEDELLVREDSLEGRNVEELDYQVGQRVLIGNVMSGTIRYVGPTHLAEGVWLGVEMDLPRGRHDGSIDGRRYFSCDPMYGLFAPPEKITVIKEDEEEEDKPGDDQEDDGGLQPSLDGEVSSVAEELEIEEQLTSEAEQDDLEEEYPMSFDDDNDDKATPQPRQDSPVAVEGAHSPEEEEEEREREEEEEEIVGEEEERSVEGEKEGEKGTEDKEGGEDVGQLQLKDEYQWPASEEGTPSPLAEVSNRLEKEIIPSITFDHVTATSKKQGGVTEQKVEEKTSQITEHPPPASEMLETLGEKSESFPLAPEVANQRSQSATPTPAPPPEFAEGASKETSIEPPPPSPLQLTGDTTSMLKQTSEVISEELAQELTNEAFETMHNIWKVKREVSSRESETKPREDDTSVSVTKEVKQSLDEKADLVTEQLLSLLIQSETNLACSIHNFKKSQEEDAVMVLEKVEEEVLSPTSRQHNHQLPRSPLAKEMERPVLSPVPEEPLDDDQLVQGQKEEEEEKEKEEELVTPTVSPRQKHAPAKLILTGSSSIIESSPPPLSPPSPYRTSHFIPSFIPAADEFSPPGSPPKHLSQASAARVAAGEKTPFMASQDKERKSMERSTSTESITSLLDSLKITTAQCMVPSERTNINQVVERSWRVCETIGFEHLHCHPPTCPNDVLDMFSDLHELSPEENHCRRAYLELVFNLTVETLQNLHVQCEDTPIWTQESAVKALLAPEHKNGGTVTLEKVQKKVYKALMRGQLPSQLPAVKFLRGMKRPGGREIDFVDTILIKELREEEPGWIDYCSDEASVKMKTADAILDSLISETVQIMNQIARKRCRESTPS